MPDPMEALENREQQLPAEERDTLADRLKAELEMLALANEVERPSDLNEEAGNARRELYSSIFGDARVDTEKLFNGLTDIRDRHHTKIADAVQKAINLKLERYPKQIGDWNPHLPVPEPPEFWWARTDPFDTSGHQMAWRDDGLHFFGGPKIDKWNVERHENFGAVALFTITADRFPPSAPPSGWWLSKPWVELVGGVVAFAPDYDLWQGHGIASCELHLRQTLFQLGLAPPGGDRTIILGESVSDRSWWIDLEDTDYDRRQAMPGGIWVPEVRFQETNRVKGSTLFAAVEVRFDIHLKSAGALVWCDPEVILRTFQWPLAPGA